MSDDPKHPVRPGSSAPIGQEPSGEFRAPRKQLTVDGRLTGDVPLRLDPLAGPDEPTPQPGGAPSLAALTTGELELARDPTVRPASTWEEPLPYRDTKVRSRRFPVAVVLALVLLGAGGLVVFWKFPRLARALPQVPTNKGSLLVTSEPSGAALFINGTDVGRTPWAADNRWGGTVKWEVRLAGHKPASGTFRGGEDAQVEAVLEPE